MFYRRIAYSDEANKDFMFKKGNKSVLFSFNEKFLPFELASFWASTSLHSRAWKGHSRGLNYKRLAGL